MDKEARREVAGAMGGPAEPMLSASEEEAGRVFFFFFFREAVTVERLPRGKWLWGVPQDPLCLPSRWEVPLRSPPPHPADLFRLLVGAGDLGGDRGEELVALEPQSRVQVPVPL